MVCLRCRMVVESEFEKLSLSCISVEPGRVETAGPISVIQMRYLKIALNKAGLELMDDKKNILVERIKTTARDMIDSGQPLRINFSDFLSNKLNFDYTYLANVFSETQGVTIEHYIIAHKIRRVKELICDNDLNLTQISWKLHYSSVAHLSTQFKKVTGITPSHFKHLDCHSLSAA